jgi:hypothetical protein
MTRALTITVAATVALSIAALYAARCVLVHGIDWRA